MAPTPQGKRPAGIWLSGISDLAIAALRKRRAAVADLDPAIAILTPDHGDYVAPRRPCRRETRRGELCRLVREALRDAGKPLAAGEIMAGIVAAKRFPDAAHAAITKMILARLGVLLRRGEIAKDGKTRNARWSVGT
jgi:hypothetical protein